MVREVYFWLESERSLNIRRFRLLLHSLEDCLKLQVAHPLRSKVWLTPLDLSVVSSIRAQLINEGVSPHPLVVEQLSLANC